MTILGNENRLPVCIRAPISKFSHENRSNCVKEKQSTAVLQESLIKTAQILRENAIPVSGAKSGHKAPTDFSTSKFKHTRGFCVDFALTRILSASSPFFTRIRLPGKDNTQTHSASPFRNVGYNKICRPLKNFFKNREYFPLLMCLIGECGNQGGIRNDGKGTRKAL